MSFKYAMERPCDARIGDKNTSADSVELWFSNTDCYALVVRDYRRSHSDFGEEQDFFFLYRKTTAYGFVIWESRKVLEDGLSKHLHPLNTKLSAEVDKAYNEWRMSNAIEEAMCQNIPETSNTSLT